MVRAGGKSFDAVLELSHSRQVSATMREAAPELSDDRVQSDADDYECTELVDLDGVGALPGAQALLSALRAAAVPWALVTSAGAQLAGRRMAAAGIELPGVAVFGDQVDQGKPHPEGYVRAADALAVPIESCVVIEDSTAGVAAGEAAGARVIVVGSRARSGAHAARVDSLTDVEVVDHRFLTSLMVRPTPPTFDPS